MVIDISKLSWDGDRIEIGAYFPDTDEKYLYVGTFEEFESWIHETEDLSDYVIGSWYEDKDDAGPTTQYCEHLMDDFMSPDYYIQFYESQKRKGLVKVIEFDFDELPENNIFKPTSGADTNLVRSHS